MPERQPSGFARQFEEFGKSSDGAYHLRHERFAAFAKVQILDDEVQLRLEALAGGPLPLPLRQAKRDEATWIWVAPREWLLAGADRNVGPLAARLSDELGDDALILDVTHGLVSFRLSGPEAQAALAAHCPLDLSPAAFGDGGAARTLLGEAVVLLTAEASEQHDIEYRLVVDQTMAAYVTRLLRAI